MNAVSTRENAAAFRPGCGGLNVEVIAGESAVTAAWAVNPLKILVPRPRGPSVWAYLSSFGGGLVAGDQTQLEIHLADNARCFISSQASTKVYRNPLGLPCGHHLTASLKAGSILALVPDPIQTFADSIYTQRQEFFLQPGAGLVLVDSLCSGRAARQERWAFTRVQSRNEVFVDGRRLLLDSLLLNPADGPLNGPHRLGQFNCLALVLILGEPLREASKRALENVAAQPVQRGASLICSASPIPDGVILRLAGEQVEEAGREVQRQLGFLEDVLEDNPWSRKW